MRDDAREQARPTSVREAPAWKREHLLDVDELTPEEIELVMDTADAMREVLSREVPRVPALRGLTVVNLFYEPSTRTRASFELAAKALGADVVNIAAEQSSVKKGESLLDTVRTVEALGAEVLVMRHWQSGAPYLAARHTRLHVVNAGDGSHAHPTQALLDIYTIRRHLGDLRGRKVVIVGDIAHSRVARSNAWGLTALGAQVVLCGPPTLLPAGLRPGTSMDDGEVAMPPVQVEMDLDKAIEGADVVMALRLQRERMAGGVLPSLREYVRLYQINVQRLARARPDALVMHPGPMNEGVEIAPEVARSAQSVIEEQVTNGVAVRMAVLYLLTGGKA
ncbi:MAG: aspartate carbamoyltransferase catalytic subunit [Dehalococcoidia bacterium]|nr:aspartate carbamoyltransferase catalytic subunit [Dehalococcoidia bacterium]MDW8009663.1 aspartate carbamoyltransferase catalytic subunit [Chloroflexota bacterium]